MLAIDWINRGTVGNDSDDFEQFYGVQNAAIARQLVNRAIVDWEKVITDFNYDGDNNPHTDNTFSLTLVAGDLGGTGRGSTGTIFSAGLPTQATVTLDDNGGNFGWYFDPTPLDDAEFTAIANSTTAGTGPAFQGSFIDVNSGFADFYHAIVHEIGHAMGLATSSPVFALSNMTFIGSDPNGGRLYSFHNPNGQYGVSATITTNTFGSGRHLFEGDHPNDLMNPGRVTPVGQPRETVRQFISDFDVKLLADAYDYTVVLPSTFDTAHVTLDSLTGTLLVQGGVNSAGVALSDAIAITPVGNEIRVQLYNSSGLYATEKVPAASVTQIVVSRAGDNVSDPGSLYLGALTVPVKTVYSVVSSNQDAVDPGSLSDNFVDLDINAPGAQVTLRAAVQNANGLAGGWIYLPRGNYRMTIAGAGGDSQGDLDISQNVTIIGTGAGESIIDASGLGANSDRVFEVAGTSGSPKTLKLDSLTVTGGEAPNLPSTPWLSHGGGIFVRDFGLLTLVNSAVVDNKTTNTSALGGGIFFEQRGGGSITNSVIAYNHSASYAGGVFLGGGSAPFAPVTVTGSIFAKNTAALPAPPNPQWGFDVGSQAAGRVFTSGGNNLIGPNNSTTALGFTGAGDYSGAVNYVVTGVADSWNSANDTVVLSVREAVKEAHITSGAIWLPAWKHTLSRDRDAFDTDPTLDTDVNVGYGDLDITKSLTLRGAGAAGATTVKWRLGVTDAVFDLIGDFNGDGITSSDDGQVSGSDYLIWQQTLGTTDKRADADDNGIVQNADEVLWRQYFGNTLVLTNVA